MRKLLHRRPNEYLPAEFDGIESRRHYDEPLIPSYIAAVPLSTRTPAIPSSLPSSQVERVSLAQAQSRAEALLVSAYLSRVLDSCHQNAHQEAYAKPRVMRFIPSTSGILRRLANTPY